MAAGDTILTLFVEEQSLKFGMTAHFRLYASQTGPGVMRIVSSTNITATLGDVQPERIAQWTHDGLPSDAPVTITFTPQIYYNGSVTHTGQSVSVTWGPNANGTADSYWNANAHGTNARFVVPAADATSGDVTEYLGAFGYSDAYFNAEYFAESLSGVNLTKTASDPSGWIGIGWQTGSSFTVGLDSAWDADGPYKFMLTGYSLDATRWGTTDYWYYQSKAYQPTWIFGAPSNPYGPTLLSMGDTLTLDSLPNTNTTVYFSYMGSNANDLIKQQAITAVDSSVSIPCNRMGALWMNIPGSPDTNYYCNVQE